MEAIGRFLKFVFMWVFYPFTREYTRLQLEHGRLDAYLNSLEIPFEKKEWGLKERVEFLLTNATNKAMLPALYKIKELSHMAAEDLLNEQLEEGKAGYVKLREAHEDLKRESLILHEQVEQLSEENKKLREQVHQGKETGNG